MFQQDLMYLLLQFFVGSGIFLIIFVSCGLDGADHWLLALPCGIVGQNMQALEVTSKGVRSSIAFSDLHVNGLERCFADSNVIP